MRHCHRLCIYLNFNRKIEKNRLVYSFDMDHPFVLNLNEPLRIVRLLNLSIVYLNWQVFGNGAEDCIAKNALNRY